MLERKRLAALIIGLAGIAGCADKSGDGSTTPDAGSPPVIDPSVARITVSAASPAARATSLSVNYWMWPAAYADDVSGTEQAVAALTPALLRMGGYNNDANVPTPFDDAEFDRAVLYARAIGAEPLVQVPLLADVDGKVPTAATAAGMVEYANVTQNYRVRYFALGNEPDLYATQGSLTNMSDPAIPGYTPDAYCATAREFATAMRAVDPSIQIVGPDLSWHYVPGNDWLTPILQSCGDVFDVVAFHRYPFDSKAATLDAAEPDAAVFAGVVAHVRGLLQATGQSDKPLALTEMNIVYDATTCQQTASPRTTGSGLWLADALGTAIEQRLFTAAVWDISDDDVYALGLIGPAPTHVPRPEYYAYLLFSQHFGPTHLDVTGTPPHVHAYASRNAANTATELIAVNWATSSLPLAVEITSLAKTPAPATFTLPALSVTAIEVPDHGAPSALTYGEAERLAKSGPTKLPSGLGDAVDTGPPALDNACPAVGATCPTTTLPDPAITTLGTTAAGQLVFGKAPYLWHSYSYAADGQTIPAAALTADGNGFTVTGSFTPPLTGGYWEGVGFYLDKPYCADVSSYTGVRFDLQGDLGGCALTFGAASSGDVDLNDDERGACPGTVSSCYPPQFTLAPPAAGMQTSIIVPFASLSAGSPIQNFDATTLITVQWQLSAPTSGECAASFTLENVAFY